MSKTDNKNVVMGQENLDLNQIFFCHVLTFVL